MVVAAPPAFLIPAAAMDKRDDEEGITGAAATTNSTTTTTANDKISASSKIAATAHAALPAGALDAKVRDLGGFKRLSSLKKRIRLCAWVCGPPSRVPPVPAVVEQPHSSQQQWESPR